MIRPGAACLCLLASACATRALVHGDGGYRPEDAAYRIAQLPDGALMPPSWRLANYESRDGVLRLKDRRDYSDLKFTREGDDGKLSVYTRDLGRSERKQDLGELVSRTIEDLSNPLWDGRQFYRGSKLQEVRAALKEPVPGCEAIDIVLDARPTDVATFISRLYLLWMRPKDRDTLTVVIYESPIQTFAPAVEDVLGLVERWSCP
jgi:hypothetical protein